MAADAKLAALERLARLRADGILTEAEFAAEKAAVLAGRTAAPAPPQVYVPPPAPPAAPPTIIYATPPPEPRRRWRPLRFAGIGLLVGLVLEVMTYLPHGGATPAGQIPACDSSFAKNLLTKTFEHSAAEKIASIQVLDVAHMTERSYDPATFTRHCAADVTFNTGDRHAVYDMHFNSDRSGILMQAQVDDLLGRADMPAAPATRLALRDAPRPTSHPDTNLRG